MKFISVLDQLSPPHKMKKIPLKNPTPDQQYCIDALARVFHGHHHLPRVYEWGSGVELSYAGGLSTVDFDKLTHMVLVAHRYAVRFEIAGSSPRYIRIIAHRRKPTTPGKRVDICHEHPTLEDLGVRLGQYQRAAAVEDRKDFQSVNKPN